MIHRHHGHAMGTQLEIVVAEDDRALVEAAVDRIDDLERRWSRFLPDSEISRLNANPAVPVIVSRETAALVQAAIDGWAATEGRFDPTVHDAVCGLGYDRTFAELRPLTPPPPGATPGAGAIEVDHGLGAITLPTGVRLDMGGIAKGTAADIVTDELIAAGADGACVSIGGDLRVRGASPSGGGWTVTSTTTTLPALDDGGVCTSTIRRRRWVDANGTEQHHIVDPRSGLPTSSAVQTVTVIGATAQQAEILTKACLVAGEGAAAFLAPFGVPAVVTDGQGRSRAIGGRELVGV